MIKKQSLLESYEKLNTLENESISRPGLGVGFKFEDEAKRIEGIVLVLVGEPYLT